MLQSLNTGITGLQQFQESMDVISNNIANVNTVGFKSSRVDFADSFSETLRASSGGSGAVSDTPAIQVGTGVGTQAISNSYTQGGLTQTGVQTDLAISGDGFFVVKDPANGAQYVTRAGDFRVDQNGFLVTNTGMRVQGFNDTGLSTQGDISIVDVAANRPAGIDQTVSYAGYSISSDGTIDIKLSDGEHYARGQILLQRFSDPQALTKEGNNLYSGIGAAGPLGGASSPTSAAANTNGLGKIQSGELELSNVDLAGEFTNMITAQRAFQASARIITTSDEMLQELVNLKR